MKTKIIVLLSVVALAFLVGWGMAHAETPVQPDTWALGWNTLGCAKSVGISPWTGRYDPRCWSVYGYQVQPGPITESSGKFVLVGGYWFEKTSVRAVSPTPPPWATATPVPPPVPTVWRPSAKPVVSQPIWWPTPLPTPGAPVPTPFVVRSGATPTPRGPCSICP